MASSISSSPEGQGDFKVLIFESASTVPKEEGGEIIEIAAALYSVEYHCILSQISTLIPPTRPAPLSSDGDLIPFDAVMSAQPIEYEAVFQIILSWASQAKYCVGHNVDQTRRQIAGHWLLSPLCECDWLCSSYDFTWPRQQRPGMNLVHLALAHGIGVTNATRALSICQLIASLMSISGDSLPDMISRAARPKCKVLVPQESLKGDKAQTSGFKWDASTNMWCRWMAIEDLASLSVKYTVLEVDPRGNYSVVWARLWQIYISHKTKLSKEDLSKALEKLGYRVWRAIRHNSAFLSVVETLWRKSDWGRIEPEALLDAFSAIELWYWTSKHPLIAKQKTAYNLPDELGSESGDATSQSSVEDVVEKVAESCLEPEDRREGSLTPSLCTEKSF